MKRIQWSAMRIAGVAAGWLAVVGAGSPWAAGAISHYEIEAEIAPTTRTMRATADLTVAAPEGGLRELELLLNRGLQVRAVTCDAG